VCAAFLNKEDGNDHTEHDDGDAGLHGHRSIGKRAGLGAVHPHMLRAAFIMAALDAGVPLRNVQPPARHADPRTTTIYDRRRENLDRHAAYEVVAFVAGG
jgi:integrase/recombinase XerD